MTDKRQERTRILLQAVAILALLFVCYYPSLSGGFLWDDDSNVTQNLTLRSAKGLQLIWSSPFANQQFYPLTHTSFWVEYQLWELWAPGYRITNVLLQGLVALLFWTGLRRLDVPGAWVAAAIFAVHPINVESVAWITERKNLLSALFYFAAFLCYLRYTGLGRQPAMGTGARRNAYAGSLLLFACALLSKTAVVTLPAALLVIVWWKRGRLRGRDYASTAPLILIGVGFGLVTAWLERRHVGAGGPEWELNLVERGLVAGRALWFYAGKLVFPVGLNFIYPRWQIDVASVVQYLFPLSALALVGLAWSLRGRIGRGPLAGLLLFGLTVAPALGFVDFYFQLYSFVQDHFQYLAGAGLIALVVALADIGLRRLHPRAPAIAATLVLVALGGLCRQRSKLFRSQELMWTTVLANNPGAWMADINLGIFYEHENRLLEAVERYERALEVPHSEHDKAHYNLAGALKKLGKIPEAIEQYQRALEANPQHAEAHINLGNIRRGEGDLLEAEEHYRAAIAANPQHPKGFYNLGVVLATQDRNEEAEQSYLESIRLDRTYASPLEGLGRLVSSQGRDDEAILYYERCLRLDPARPVVHYNLGFIKEQRGDLTAAERHYVAAIQLDPQLAEAYNNLAIVLYNTQRYADAWKGVQSYEQLGGIPHPDFIRALSAAHPRP